MNLETALARFLVQLEADGRSEHTRKQYRRHVRALSSWLRSNRRSLDVRRIGHQALAEFFASPEARSRPDGRAKKATSTNAMRTSLRVFFAYLDEAGFTQENAARLIRHARCSSPPPRGLGEGDRKKLLAVLARSEGPEAERDRALFGLMLHAGLRLGSALAIEAEDVDLERAEVRLCAAKGNRLETVVLGKAALKLLRERVAECPRGPLFPGRGGRPISARHAQRRFRAWCRQAGVHGAASSHSLRHAFAMELYGRTGDVALVQRALGHRSIASTLVYARADEARLRAALG